MIAIDARGHGKSDKPHDPAAYQLARQANDVICVLDSLGLKSAGYWGYSMGGRIGFALARDHLDRFSHLVIGGAHPFARTLPQRARTTDPDEFIRVLYARTGGRLDSLPLDMKRILYGNDFAALDAATQDWPSLADVVPAINIPTCLYVGDQDAYLEKMQSYATEVPTAQPLINLPGLNHTTAFTASKSVLDALTPCLNGIHPTTS
ncbi:alpha/beta fold hydrolase [Terripilifer ovatus]|uniref:alpha/beta fold hydrolase n=1 Tax=Terripilifer ovatus TaxID=3032367 RepID=UPI003AB995DC